MIDLDDLGIHEGISEVIFTTISPGGVANAAPIGLHRKGEKLFARIFNSRTLDNIIEKNRAAANVVVDPLLFVKSALSDIEPEKFEFIDGFPVLKEAQAWIIFDCKCRKGDVVSVAELEQVKAKINFKDIRPVNRGFNAVIEATVNATRYVVLKDKKFLDHIEYYNSIVKKCGGEREKKAMGLLFEMI